jgi:RNA polymerase sporulation-specific sigma factor
MEFELMSDEELAVFAKNDKKKPFEILFSRYKNNIDLIIRSKITGNVSGVDYDDLLQECALALDSAVDSYDGQSRFKAFACTCISNRVVSALRGSGRRKNEPLKNYVPLSGYADEDVDKSGVLIDSKVGPEDMFINNEKKLEMESLIKSSLSELEYKVFILHGQGFSYDEIAKEIDQTAKVVDNAMQRVRKKLGTKFS